MSGTPAASILPARSKIDQRVRRAAEASRCRDVVRPETLIQGFLDLVLRDQRQAKPTGKTLGDRRLARGRHPRDDDKKRHSHINILAHPQASSGRLGDATSDRIPNVEGAASDPSQLEFVLSPEATGIDLRSRADYDLYLGRECAPLVVLVHGPVRGAVARPRKWPVYRGYATLLANAGFSAAIADLAYNDTHQLDGPQAQLESVVETARSESGVDPARGAVWAFSGGSRLVGRWIEEPPEWLKGIALTYPAAPSVARVNARLVVTRVGIEHPRIQETVDQLLAIAPSAEIIEVPNGQHGFDMLDHTDESRDAVKRALNAVAALLGVS
jgi:dienelactone hydrolase